MTDDLITIEKLRELDAAETSAREAFVALGGEYDPGINERAFRLGVRTREAFAAAAIAYVRQLLAQPAGSGGVAVDVGGEAPATADDALRDLRWMHSFLNGDASMSGSWFGDDNATGRYWWRAELTKVVNNVALFLAAAPASPQGWLPIESAPNSGAFLMLCDGGKDSARVFFAEASFEGADGALVWHITTGWMGWSKLHSAWTPSHWQPLPSTSIALGGPTDLIGLAHNAISRALDEAGIKQPVHRGMCLEVGLQTFADGLPPSSGDGRGVG